jgi:predicted RNase H-like HicB family nuclease
MLYELQIEVQELTDGGDYRYMATSPDLPNLIVAGDTAEEVLNLAPQVAAALITSMKERGDPLPATLPEAVRLAHSARVTVAA